jgi:hypothetical protein
MARPLIDYFVLDSLANDLESLEDMLRILNSEGLGWRSHHMVPFERDEILPALFRGIRDGLIRAAVHTPDGKALEPLEDRGSHLSLNTKVCSFMRLRIVAATLAGLLACGLRLWPIPYRQVSLPGNPAASTWLLLGAMAGVVAGYLVRQRLWIPIASVTGGFVLAVLVRVEVETTRGSYLSQSLAHRGGHRREHRSYGGGGGGWNRSRVAASGARQGRMRRGLTRVCSRQAGRLRGSGREVPSSVIKGTAVGAGGAMIACS